MSPEEKMAGAKGSQIVVANTVQMHASMNRLIVWNISKALEKNPCMDLKTELRAAQEQLERDARLGNAVMSEYLEEQHLLCALLAWQQLGHTDADSLYQFIENKKNEELRNPKPNARNSKFHPNTFIVASNVIKKQCNNNLTLSEDVDSLNFGSYSKGPVVRLPVEPKIIMRMDHSSSRDTRKPQPRKSQPRKSQPNTSSKVIAACCMDTECAKNLAAIDADTEELRKRAAQLAKREAERVELLERAESAWADLELGYQRRIRLAEEKVENMTAQICKTIQERNNHKDNCEELAEQLKEVGEAAECEREKLIQIDKNVCERACRRLRLSEEAAKGETVLAEEQCKAVQLERDLQERLISKLKEEQARRKLLTMDNETESARVLMYEAERALRAELGGLRDQITDVSNLLLEVDDMIKNIKEELEELRKEKADLIENLDGCKSTCDTRMQSQIDELQKKRQELMALKEKVIECQCKLPVDVGVEVKRTASLAGLCKCSSDDRFTDACSCTSLRSRLISSLLADLFGGLQSELGGAGLQMPCQLLKCLEDKHNWDRSSVIKTNLQNFFSKLLVGELDIAIATSIENYHAKWTGTSCADEFTMKPSPNEDLSQGWENRTLERRAQKLAEELAEQLFQDRADELTARAKQIVKSGPPPCECKAHHNKDKKEAAVLQGFVAPFSPFTHTSSQRQPTETLANWNRTHQDVTQLRLQIEDLKKEFIKKEDLKLMEENITKIVKQAAVPDIEIAVIKDNMPLKNNKKDKSIKNTNIDEPFRPSSNLHKTKKRSLDANSSSKKYSVNEKPTKQPKKYNYNQAYAVNLCMCGPQKPNKILQTAQLNMDAKSSLKQKPSKEIIPRVGSMKQTKPIEINFPPPDTDEIISKVPIEASCGSDCKCFQKMPSNASIDKLLRTLTKWKCDLGDSHGKLLNNEGNSLNTNSFLARHSKTNLKNKVMNNSKVGFSSTNHNVQDNDIGILTETPMHFNEIGKKCQVPNFNLAANTTSEYMGAINLDKSIENVSTRVDTTEFNDVRQRQETIKNISNECTIQSTNLSENPFTNEDVQQSQSKDYTKVKLLNEHLYGKIKNTTDFNVLTNSKSAKTVIPEGEHKLKTKEILNQTDLLSNELKATQLFPNNFDYYIKFLGVTLADADSHSVTKSNAKDGHKKTKTYSPSSYKDILLENQSERQNTEMPKLFSDLQKQLVDDNASDSLIKTEKCACNTKFEEFQRFMINIFSDQSKKKNTQQKDKALDSPSLKCTGNHLENCACCNSFNIDNSKDLEANAFYLLEDHLKEKLKEFKTCSCKSSCISPKEEEKILSAILNRVKQVISDCANEAKCNIPGMTTDASWKRAYGLLQEYLKIKIKRAQYSPSLNENKDVVVPNILEKLCNLIENDFQRLKDLCKCKKNDETLTKKALIEHLLLPHEDIPEKDTCISVNDNNITCKMLSKQNLVKPIAFLENISSQVTPEFGTEVSFDAMTETNCTVTTISKQNSTDCTLITQTISSQVPPNLGLETKSCDALEIDNKNEQTSETTLVALNKKSQGIIYNTCYCNYRREKTEGEETPVLKKKLLKNKYVPIYLTTDISNMTKTITPYQKQYQTKLLKCPIVTELGVAKSLPNFVIMEYDKKCYYTNKRDANHTESTVKQPYLGCTIDCTCSGNFEECICSKSMIQHCTHKIGDNWKQFIVSNNNCDQDLSYIMNASYKKKNDDIIERMTNDFSSDLPTFIKKNNCGNACETEANDKEVVPLLSRQTISKLDVTTLATDLDSEDSNSLAWVKNPQTLNTTETKTSIDKFTNFQYDYEPIDDSMKSCKSDITTDTETSKISQNCNCYQVPICHVKMLIEDIERNIIESKCTCDSVLKICPVHSKKYL